MITMRQDFTFDLTEHGGPIVSSHEDDTFSVFRGDGITTFSIQITRLQARDLYKNLGDKLTEKKRRK